MCRCTYTCAYTMLYIALGPRPCFLVYIYIYICIYICGPRLCRRRLFLCTGFHDTWYLEWCVTVTRNTKVGGWQLMPHVFLLFSLIFIDFTKIWRFGGWGEACIWRIDTRTCIFIVLLSSVRFELLGGWGEAYPLSTDAKPYVFIDFHRFPLISGSDQKVEAACGIQFRICPTPLRWCNEASCILRYR